MKKIFYVAATAAMLASCSTDFDLSEVFGSGGTSETIGFVSYPHPREKMGTIAAEKLFNMISGRHEESVVFPWE